jgi:hypothetical protein
MTFSIIIIIIIINTSHNHTILEVNCLTSTPKKVGGGLVVYRLRMEAVSF